MNWTVITTITLILSNPFNIGLACNNNTGATEADFNNVQTQEEEQPRRVEGILEPGGTFVGAGGVIIKAPDGLEEAAEVYVEIVDDPRGEYPFPTTFPKGIEVISPFFRIGAVGEPVYSRNGRFDLSFPLPEGVTRDQAYILNLQEASQVLTQLGTGISWFTDLAPILVGANDYMGTQYGAIESKGIIYVVVKLPESKYRHYNDNK